MPLPLALVIIAGAVVLMARRVEVRLVLIGAGLLLALGAGQPLVLLDAFTRGMVAAMVAPICAAMGFAAVLHATGCDEELVHLLLAPVRRVRWLLLPGGILAAYLVNLAVPSQTSTAAALGPILVPLMLAAGASAEVAGAALILGASFGGDLLNPGAQDVQAIADAARLPAPAISARVVPASLAGAVVAAAVFALCARREVSREAPPPDAGTGPAGVPRVRPFRALIPLLPVALLLLAYGGWPPLRWLVSIPDGAEWKPLAGALPVVRAMLIGTMVALAAGWRRLQEDTRAFFEGMGTAYGSIISLTIAAQCFGAGIGAAGVGAALLRLLDAGPLWGRVLAVFFPWSLALLSGSGSGPILAFAQTFLAGVDARHAPVTLASLACLAGAFGRTMSPVAAVVVYTSGLVGTPPMALLRRLLPALAAGAVVALAVALLR